MQQAGHQQIQVCGGEADCFTLPSKTVPSVSKALQTQWSIASQPAVKMLINQAAIAFERWTGVAGMAGVMRAAVAPLLADAAAPA